MIDADGPEPRATGNDDPVPGVPILGQKRRHAWCRGRFDATNDTPIGDGHQLVGATASAARLVLGSPARYV